MANIKKQAFIEEIEHILYRLADLLDSDEPLLSEDAATYFAELKAGRASTGEMTESGLKIIAWMQSNCNRYNNIFSAKIVGEGLFMNSRAVSGAMRKLISDGYVSKTGSNPVSYSLTGNGVNYNFKN